MSTKRLNYIDHSTFQRWVERFASLLDGKFRKRKHSVISSWRMDETYIKVKGRWVYLYRAVDIIGCIINMHLNIRITILSKFMVEVRGA